MSNPKTLSVSLQGKNPSGERTEPKQFEVFELLKIMEQLRDPDGGCPWDVEQTFASIAPHTIEEAYEVADAIARNDIDALKCELGDLLFQSVFHARIAEEAGYFNFADVVHIVCQKMLRRHPHVFGDAVVKDATEQAKVWEEIKASERALEAKGKDNLSSALEGIPTNLPSMKMAEKLQKRAAHVGFDWSEAKDVISKIHEELTEVTQEFQAENINIARLTDEIGDLLFACINLSRKAKIDPETALRSTNLKFGRRFRRVEALLASKGRTPSESTLKEMETLWVQTKVEERLNGGI